MELQTTRPQHGLSNGHDIESSVPSHDPVLYALQPRVTPNGRRRKYTKYFQRVSLHPVLSNDSVPNVHPQFRASDQGLHPNGSLQGRPQNEDESASSVERSQHNGTLEVGQNAGLHTSVWTTFFRSGELDGQPSQLRLDFWRRLISPRDQASTSVTHTECPPVQAQTHTTTAQTSITNHAVSDGVATASTQMNPQSTEIPSEATPLPATVNAQVDPDQFGTRVAELEVRIEVDSDESQRKLYSPEQGIYVGHQYDLPPPAQLTEEWIRIKEILVKNIISAIQASELPKRKPHRSFEPELCMSGQLQRRQLKVVLKPTIWIRCGSSQCQDVVEAAVAHLRNYTKGFPVHVTLHAPQPAGTSVKIKRQSTRKTVFFPRMQGGISSRINPTKPSRAFPLEGWVTTIGHNVVYIRLQSFRSNHNSACGLEIQFQASNGERHTCKLGGLVCLDDTIFGLTTAHALCDPRLGMLEHDDNYSSTTHFTHGPTHGEEPALSSYPALNTAWMPATIFAARYGVSYDLSDDSIQPLSPLSGDVWDFALLQMKLDSNDVPQNWYRLTATTSKFVDRTSQDLRARPISLVCSYDDVKPGKLLEGDRIFVDETGIWKTRKIQLENALGPGASGTWVVDGSALLGVIIAVYDTEPYAHMIPIASMFSGIQNMFPKQYRRPSPQVKLPELRQPPAPSPRIETTPPESSSQSVAEISSIVEPIAESPTKEKVDESRNGPHLHHAGIPNTFQLGAFVPMCLVVFLIGLENSAFPMIMPAITDTFESMHLVGWYGSAYLLGVATMYPTFEKLYPTICGVWRGRGLVILLFTCLFIFEAGALCCFLASSGGILLLGRVICSIGAAGSFSGISFLYTEIFPKGSRSRSTVFALVNAFSRVLGPLIGAAITNSVRWAAPWRAVFLVYLVAMVFPFFIALLHLIMVHGTDRSYSLPPDFHAKYSPTEMSQRKDFFTRDVVRFVSSSGTMVCLELGLYYGAMLSWSSALTILLLTISGVCLILFILHQNLKVSNRMLPSQAFETLLLFLWGASYYSFNHYFPTWLQALREDSPLKAGITFLPTTTTHFIMIFFTWVLRGFSAIRKYSFSAHLVSLVCMALAAGLMSRFDKSTSSSSLLGLQVLFGAGAGFRSSRGMVPFYVPGDSTDRELGIIGGVTEPSPGFMIIAETIGGSAAISAAQTVFWTQLSRGIRHSNQDLRVILQSGATIFKKRLGSEVLDAALDVFNDAITKTFYVSTAAGAFPYAAAALGICVALPFGLEYAIYLRPR